MKHRVLKVGRWVIDCLFAEKDYDVDGVVAVLRDTKAPSKVIGSAKRLMESGRYDTGFTFANPLNFRAVVVIGPQSSGKEFIDTLVHEIHHVAVAIASELGVDLEDETPAYLSGNAMRELVSLVCTIGCGCD